MTLEAVRSQNMMAGMLNKTTVIAIISVALSKNHHNDIISAGQVIIHYDNI
jgi:hypothetical protein